MLLPEAEQRLEKYIEPEPMSGCWLWVGARDQRGYGMVARRLNARTASQRAHRYVYERLIGPIADGLTLDHLCRTHSCVNPAHCEPVTHRINVLRGVGFAARNARKAHCPQGHPYDDKTTTVWANGRYCRACFHLRYIARTASTVKHRYSSKWNPR